jgi:hypothetical protein
VPPRAAAPAPPRQSPAAKAFFLVVLLGMVLVVGFLGWRAFDAARDLQGDEVLVIEKVNDVEGAYVLDPGRTAQEAPELDRLLFLAFRSGKGTTNEAVVVRDVEAYLDSLAREEGHERFADPPFENVFRWGEEDTFRVIRFSSASR